MIVSERAIDRSINQPVKNGGGGEGSNQSSEFFDEAVDRCSAEDHVLAMDSPPSFACVRMKS